LYGVFALDELARGLDPDQPIYGVHARGFDGKDKPCETVKAMAAHYITLIRKVCPNGPYLVGGMCHGSLVAIEMARELLLQNKPVGPVLMIDPGVAPHRGPAGLQKLEQALGQPSVMAQLREQAATHVRHHASLATNWPFDPDDPVQAQRAAEVALVTGIAFARHKVAPFYGATAIILSSDWAHNFFDPKHDWQKVLPAKRTLHILPGVHTDLFTVHRSKVYQLIKIQLEAAASGQSGDGAGAAAKGATDEISFEHMLNAQ
jgi:thioesterase domain-containing protein